MDYCKADGCLEKAFRRGLCRGHEKQQARGSALRPIEPRLPPKELAVKAALDLAEAESDQDYRRAEDRFAYASERWTDDRRRKRQGRG